ncbi:hypothetical protein STEG23_033142, partial [Scotinomys teguina]
SCTIPHVLRVFKRTEKDKNKEEISLSYDSKNSKEQEGLLKFSWSYLASESKLSLPSLKETNSLKRKTDKPQITALYSFYPPSADGNKYRDP